MVSHFIAGALGEPGNRTFLLQLEGGAGVESYLVEKEQVAAMCEEALDLLHQIGFTGAGSGIEVGELIQPDSVEFRVGDIHLGYAEGTGVITLVLGDTENEGERVSFTMTPALLDAAMQHGREVVAAGRPPCPRCGLSLDPDGHNCPKDNGDLRERRP